ncbi:transcription factor MYB44-like protein [Artemisia annua]|uniref:Transcription factor MYB44-like protein n=1 Tax=Artemisia annua TaxID=35608 RepID=A0A2U1KAP9_ARTAN|nr:transcription factor MYB44-like protein [Artemisia annua]
MDQIQLPWSPEEDEMLLNLIEKHSPEEDRSGKSCWSRWFSFQRSFTPEEDEMLLKLVDKHGRNWSLISKSIPGRSAKSCELRWETLWKQPKNREYIENHWNSTLKRKSISMTNEEARVCTCIPLVGHRSAPSREQESSYIHDENSSHEVEDVVRSQPPSIDDIARDNMSSGSMHSDSRDGAAPSWSDLFKRDSSPTMTESIYC